MVWIASQEGMFPNMESLLTSWFASRRKGKLTEGGDGAGEETGEGEVEVEESGGDEEKDGELRLRSSSLEITQASHFPAW